MKRFTERVEKRKMSSTRDAATHFSLSRRFYRKIGLQGGKKKRALMSTKASRELARKAALTRYPNGKEAKIRAARLKAWDTRRAKAAAAMTTAEAA